MSRELMYGACVARAFTARGSFGLIRTNFCAGEKYFLRFLRLLGFNSKKNMLAGSSKIKLYIKKIFFFGTWEWEVLMEGVGGRGNLVRHDQLHLTHLILSQITE